MVCRMMSWVLGPLNTHRCVSLSQGWLPPCLLLRRLLWPQYICHGWPENSEKSAPRRGPGPPWRSSAYTCVSRIIWYNDNFPLFPISENGGCESKKKIQGGLEVADGGKGMDTGHQLFVLRQQVRDEKYYTENCDWHKIRFIRSNQESRLPEQTQPHNCVEKETEDCIWTGLIKPFYHDLIPGQRISWQLDNVLDPVTEPSGPLDLPPGNRGGHHWEGPSQPGHGGLTAAVQLYKVMTTIIIIINITIIIIARCLSSSGP